MALTILRAALARVASHAELVDLASRIDNAQHLARMGDYDWHIPTDTNRWSDELFRIYGHEPQSFNPSYETFVSLLHPDDRDRITALHKHAYATGEPYAMAERIVRPDGEVRHLSSNGEVVMGPDGTPVRMRGTCIDVTDRVLAEREREHLDARYRSLVESAPDAILVIDETDHVLDANPRAVELLRGNPTRRWLGDLAALDADGLGRELTLLDLLETADLRRGHRVLDVGCGSGTLLLAAAEVGAEPVGVDISPGMVAAAVRRVPSAEVRVLDAQTGDLQGSGAAFDRGTLRFACWGPAEANPIFAHGYEPINSLLAEPTPPPKRGRPGPTAFADTGDCEGCSRTPGGRKSRPCGWAWCSTTGSTAPTAS